MNRRDICFLIGGTAFGTLAASLFWKYFQHHFDRSSSLSILQSVSEACCWPWSNAGVKQAQPIHVISETTDFDAVLSKFLIDVNIIKVIGIDCEWTTTDSTSNPIALLQLATANGHCYLVRLCKLGAGIPKEIMQVLENKTVIKVGVGALGDAARLLKDHGITVQGCLDLRSFASRYQITQARSLQTLAEEMLDMKLDKSIELRCSDWDADTLSDDQIKYAAYDALSAVHIFGVLLQQKFLVTPPCQEDINKTAQNICWTFVRSSIQGLVDVPFREKKKLAVDQPQVSNNNRQNSMKGIPKNPKLFKSMKTHSTRQQPLYDNCRLQAPDGQLLSTIDRKKARWYMDKDLAEFICDDPFTVRLFFEPSGRPDNDRDYYLYEKENKCVVCGGTESFVRKNIIPHEYRKHFALPMKDHTSHDILLLCMPCFQQSNYHDCLLRRLLAEEYKAPHQGSMQAMRLFEDPKRRAVRSAELLEKLKTQSRKIEEKSWNCSYWNILKLQKYQINLQLKQASLKQE